MDSSPESAAVAGIGLVKRYGRGNSAVAALAGVDIQVRRGEFVAITGPSGSGKSTLLHCLSGLDNLDDGKVWIGGVCLNGLKEQELTRLRRDRTGFVFQHFHLLPTLTARDNMLLPLAIAARRPDPSWFREVVELVGLGQRLDHLPGQLSGGQQQRVACARAILGRPEVLFADEPTGNLDSRSGRLVLDLLRVVVDEVGQTVVMVTHDPMAAARADRVVRMSDGLAVNGQVSSATTNTATTTAATR